MLDIPVMAAKVSLGLTMEANMILEHYTSLSVGIWIGRCNVCKNDFTVVKLRLLYLSISLAAAIMLKGVFTFGALNCHVKKSEYPEVSML